MSFIVHSHVHGDVVATCSAICKCQAKYVFLSPSIIIHACIHSLIPLCLLWARPGRSGGFRGSESTIQSTSCPPFRTHLKIIMGKCPWLWTLKCSSIEESIGWGVRIRVKYKGISTGGPQAHLSHDDLLSPLPVFQPS